MTDPAGRVDEFSKIVAQWRLERERWEKSIPLGGHDPWGTHSHVKVKLLRDLDGLFKLQDQINVMMLAALDDLRKQSA